ncbi:MAG: enoyl-CoA hydratase/isomerase family protein [Desulfobacterales bacterium]|nr:enoyl-CoA hydratase/isomerase family protein [Desulfobacterales bacterium]
MSTDAVLFEINDHIAVITLNRPENRNSMTAELLTAFHAAVTRVQREHDVRCVIITGSGPNFCAGADFKSVLGEGDRLPHENFRALYLPFLAVADIEPPVIAALNGHAIGGGFGLALICDLRVANMQAKFGANFTRLGFHSGMAVTHMLPRLIGLPRANELLLSGRLVSGARAADLGIVNYAEEPTEVMPRALKLAREIAACAPAVVRMMKRSIYRDLDWAPWATAELDAHLQSRTFEMEDAREGVAALLEKREPVFKGR